MTNRDWLTSLSDEEFADWLTDLSNGKLYPADLCIDFSPNAKKTEHAQTVVPMVTSTVICQ